MERTELHMSLTDRLERLAPPSGHRRIPFVLDTDPGNEIDDQFAIVHAILSSARLDCKAIHAAPFTNFRSENDQRRGMELSYQTATDVLARLHLSASDLPAVYRGAPRFATSPTDPSGFTGDPVSSHATENLIRLAREQPEGEPLYVVGIAAITNVASAILLAPDIITKLVVVWLAGHPHTYYDTDEFNLRQDPFASRVILDSGVPLVLIPCYNVAEHLALSITEVKARVAGRGGIGTYLADEFLQYATLTGAVSRPIWDMAPIAWLLDPRLVETAIIPTPILGTSPLRTDIYFSPHLDKKPDVKSHRRMHCTWSVDPRRHAMREAFRVRRDSIFEDLFRKLDAHVAE
jgi:inosine-uridine nucleoside N-ribohydrolase